ncbi:hypothetical protein AHAS_Ahas15G0257700 [Arachis hypogaea]
MPYEFLLHSLHPDAPFHLFHDGSVPYQHLDQPKDQVIPELEPMEEQVPEPIPKRDIPLEQISVSSSEPSSEELYTTSISRPTSMGQSSSTSARTPPKIVEIFSDDNSLCLGAEDVAFGSFLC